MAQPKKRPFVSLKGMETGRITSAGKPVYKYKGEEISEKSIDIEADGKTYVIPTVIDGKLYTEEAAISKFFNKEVEPIKVLKENIKERSQKLAEGGTAMKKQMELFEDGGLKEEGGMVDEVSGNDVPVGSTREEVRDDIPAQLSEGEFVFPADVVRYIGLEKLMKLRQEAKQGLKQMEAMGQMGNSEEATMPDDLPFDETDLDIENEEDVPFDESDLDMEDDLEYNIGGYVPPDISPFDVRNRKVDPIFSTPTLPIAGAPKPVTKKQSDFDKLLDPTGSNLINTNNPSLVPQAKMVRYFNKDTNQVRMIPHLTNPDGSQAESIYPIPTGFVPSEEQPKKIARSTSVVPSAGVIDEGGDDGGKGPGVTAVDPAGDELGYQSIFSGNMDPLDKAMQNIGNMQKSLLGLTSLGISGNIMGRAVKGLTGKSNLDKITLGVITNSYTKAKKDLGIKGQNIVNLDEKTRNKLTNVINKSINIVDSVSKKGGKELSQKEIVKNVNKLATIYGLTPITTKRNFNLDKDIQNKLSETQREREKVRAKIRRLGLLNPQQGFDMDEALGLESLSPEEQLSIMESLSQGVSTGPGPSSPGGETGMGGGKGGTDSNPASDDFGGYTDTSGLGVAAKGGFFTKTKMTKQKSKVKRMKRGGLASKK